MNIQRYVGLDNRLPGEENPMKVATNLVNAFQNNQNEATVYSLTYFSKKKTNLAEKDWLEGKFAVKFGPAGDHEKLHNLPEHQILKKFEGVYVPVRFDGLKEGDCVGIILDGNNNSFVEKLAQKVAHQNICLMGIESDELEELSDNSAQRAEAIKDLLEKDIRHFCLIESE